MKRSFSASLLIVVRGATNSTAVADETSKVGVGTPSRVGGTVTERIQPEDDTRMSAGNRLTETAHFERSLAKVSL